MSEYHYTSLGRSNCIRLIYLEPGNLEAQLVGKIITASFSDEPKYSAVSYAWGSDEKPHTLFTEDGNVCITNSLNSAFRRLRSPTEEVVVWADAISINQNDNQEKSHQVRLMRDIYAKALDVLVYLGDEADNSNLACSLFEVLGRTDWCEQFGLQPRENFDTTLIMKGKADPFPSFDDPSWEAARAVLRRSWFRRAWIVQEFAVGREVEIICGSWKLKWDIVYSAVQQSRLHNLSFLSAGPDYSTEISAVTELGWKSMRELGVIRFKFQSQENLHISTLLHAFRHTLATRSRDHLFALLGLASDAQDKVFDPDYDEPLELVVKRYGSEFYRRGQGPNLLSEAGISTHPSRFPSWIPDWTKIHNRITRLETGCSLYNASGTSQFYASVSPDKTVLTIRGAIFDAISSAGQSHVEHPHSGSTIKPLDPIIDRHAEARSLLSTLQTYPTGEDLETAFWRTLITNKCDLTQEAPDDFAELYTMSIEVLNRKQARTGTFDTDGKILAKAWPYLEWMLKSFEFMRFCVTNKGYIGLCAESAKAGDVVAIIEGMSTPCVLRKENYQGKEGYYRLVGQCYVHGIMKGEAYSKEPAIHDLLLW